MAKLSITDDFITRDLMQKAADDVGGALMRTLRIADIDTHLAISMSAGAACVGAAAAIIWKGEGGAKAPAIPDLECMVLAGLLLARFGQQGGDPIGDAYKDFDALKAAGRLKSHEGKQ